MEENLRRSLVLYDGSIRFLWERPATGALLLVSLLVIVVPAMRKRAAAEPVR